MVVARVIAGREGELRALLRSMNSRPGVADPDNPLLPFGRFETLHFARLAILEDQTIADLQAYGASFPDAPVWLAFLGDCDGPAEELLANFVRVAATGLTRIFSHCRDFDADGDLLRWMRDHEAPPATHYVNWRGRTVRQIREEDALYRTLRRYLDQHFAALEQKPVQQVRRELLAAAASVPLIPDAPQPLGRRMRTYLHLVSVPFVLLLLLPVLLLYSPLFLWQLRRRETRDPEITPRPSESHVHALSELEDHDVSNQFSAVGSVKPGLFRRGTLLFVFWLLSYSTQHVYDRGRLARVSTIHFARWVFLDGRRRLFFGSNYDGSLDSYMDDFINKVAWGLNLVFSNGVGYPRTNFLINGGAKIEQKFKYYIRRHQLPTEVWYKAYPGLTALDLARNTHIRKGVEQPTMTDAEIRRWLALL
jgi:hypothetical protein